MRIKSKKKRIISSIISIGLWGVAAVYILALLKIILFKYGFTEEIRRLNLIPFTFITDLFSDNTTIDVGLKNVLGNFALFIPMGVLLPLLFKNISRKKTILICFGVSLFFEVIQYIVGLGASDIDDLILNTLGGIMGAWIYFVFLKKFDNKATVKVATFAFLSVFGICGVVSLYLYEPNMLPSQVEFVNQEVLEGLDTHNYDVEATCIAIKEDTLLTDIERRFFSANYNNDDNKDGGYRLEDDTQFFVEKKEFKYSPNGNIQKTTITYDEIVKEELEKLVEEEEISVSLWMSDDNKCNTVLATQYGNPN